MENVFSKSRRSLEQLAQEFAAAFKTQTREDGSTFTRLSGNWLKDDSVYWHLELKAFAEQHYWENCRGDLSGVPDELIAQVARRIATLPAREWERQGSAVCRAMTADIPDMLQRERKLQLSLAVYKALIEGLRGIHSGDLE